MRHANSGREKENRIQRGVGVVVEQVAYPALQMADSCQFPVRAVEKD